MHSFEERLAKLERSNRRYRILLMCVLIILAGVGILGFKDGEPEWLVARGLSIVNEEGKRMATLEGNLEGQLKLYSVDGEEITRLGTMSHMHDLYINNDSGETGISLHARDQVPGSEGNGQLLLYTGKGRPLIIMRGLAGNRETEAVGAIELYSSLQQEPSPHALLRTTGLSVVDSNDRKR